MLFNQTNLKYIYLMQREHSGFEAQKNPEVENGIKEDFPYSAIIVCGAGFSGAEHGLSPLGLQRTFAAYHAYKLGLAPKIVLTGGPQWIEERGYLEEENVDPATREKAKEKVIVCPDGALKEEVANDEAADPDALNLQKAEQELSNIENDDRKSDVDQIQSRIAEERIKELRDVISDLKEKLLEKRKDIRKSRQNIISTTPNSQLMKAVLVNRLGVPETDILCDELSVKTTDNFAEAINVLNRENLPADNFLVVSDGFHVERIAAESDRYGKKLMVMATETSLLLRSLAKADQRKETDRKNRFETHMSNQEIEERYQEVLSRWREIYNKRGKASTKDLAINVMGEGIGLSETEKTWSVWGPLMLILEDEEMIEKILDLGINQYNKNYLTWKEKICKLLDLSSDISDQEIKEKIINKSINSTELRRSRLRAETDQNARDRMVGELIERPELMKQYVDISGTILSLYHQPELLKQFLHSPYAQEIDEWRIRHEDELGGFDSYEDLCSALLNAQIERSKIAKSREKIIDPDRRKSEIIDQ